MEHVDIYDHENNIIYSGNVFNNYRHGKGIAYKNNTPYYIGSWKNGMKHGIGKIIVEDGSIIDGYFYNNRLIRTIYENEPIYEILEEMDEDSDIPYAVPYAKKVKPKKKKKKKKKKN